LLIHSVVFAFMFYATLIKTQDMKWFNKTHSSKYGDSEC